MFARISAGRYRPPSAAQARQRANQLHALIEKERPTWLQKGGLWWIAHDAATSTNGHQMVNFMAVNADNKVVFLGAKEVAWLSKSGDRTASWISRILEHKVGWERVAGIVTDGCSSMKKEKDSVLKQKIAVFLKRRKQANRP